ncbi:hypothetical protein RHGRI_016323 [Rhododendron griersonianum]|uniref:Leucine-rich repeat-containing N-terminal plant-type domain-containing protein n=1 Tax=Rhododendron griersonianum TaxID=479676 RepID=A0AAV6JTS9_9ERIC|nr:hypothetical protein RHGRI_016323 [Rhododendron griersonianum]
MGFFFLSNTILQIAILVVLIITSKCLVHGVETPRLSIITDKEALISFKSGIDPETLGPLLTWDQTLSPCNWTGVWCNKVGARVVELDLAGLGLKGSISPHIGNLSFLRSLQLQNNQLMGTFPNQLDNLFRLRVLNMSFNIIQGVIPQNISRCTELEILDLEKNEISGIIPRELSYLAKLQVLNLGRNHLFGSIPPYLANLSSLAGRSRDEIDEDFLEGSGEGFGGGQEAGFGEEGADAAAVANEGASSGGPKVDRCRDRRCSAVEKLRWAALDVQEGSLHNLTKIQVIRMADNLLHGTVPPGLGNLPELQMYNIGFNRIVGVGDNGLDFLTSLTNSTRLNILAVDGNLLVGVIPESIGNLSKVLSKLNMGGNRIHGGIPASIGHLSGLTLLNLSYNSISYDIPQEIGNLVELLRLGLAGNNISEYGMGEKPSTAGDVYSYGIMLLELFTGKSPTHESFTGDLSLKKWVQMAIATNVDQVSDPGLVQTNSSLSDDVPPISTPKAQSDCSIAVLGVGLACTVDSPDGRISMRDALCKLKSIRENLFKPDHAREI